MSSCLLDGLDIYAAECRVNDGVELCCGVGPLKHVTDADQCIGDVTHMSVESS